jgi:hypothetical protein
MSKENKGIEFSLVESWDGWDEQDIGDFYFYNVKLREDVFGSDFIEKYKEHKLDLSLWTQSSVVEIYIAEDETGEPIFKQKIKVVFEEE